MLQFCHITFFLFSLLRYTIVFFFITVGTSNGQINIYGKVLNKQDSTPIADAHVLFPTGLVGTSTNDQGRFVLPRVPLNSKIQISCIGFDIKTVDISTTDEVIIFMNPSTSLLEEVVINLREDSAKAILKRAVKNIKSNYHAEIQLNAFFRELLIQDTVGQRLVEAFINIWDPGIKKSPIRIRTQVRELRKSDDLTARNLADWLLSKVVKQYNQVAYLLEWDIVRHYFYPSTKTYVDYFQLQSIFDESDDIQYRIEEILSSKEQKIYKIRVQQELPSAILSSSYFINASDYAILKIEFQQCFHNPRATQLWGGCQLKGVYEYKLTDGRYHLSYASLRRGVLPSFSALGTGKKGDRSVYYQLLVTGIDLKPKKIPDKLAADVEGDLIGFKCKYNFPFWKSTAIPLMDKNYQFALEGLNTKISLDEQFERNGRD